MKTNHKTNKHHSHTLSQKLRMKVLSVCFTYASFIKKDIVLLSTLVCCLTVFSSRAIANPTGADVAAGSVTISNPDASTVQINQSSQRAIINWQQFNVGANETAKFVQPTGGVILNRINPANGGSSIYGQITANGQVILVNPAGIYFGPSAHVNVGGLIASTGDISDQNFLNGMYHFVNLPNYAGSIINEGQLIAAQHGLIALIGNAVSNTGLIEANRGHVILASGGAFTLSFAGNDLINFTVDQQASSQGVDQNGHALVNGISNTGELIANGGSIVVTAQSAANVLDHAINMSGVAEANSIGQTKGEIILSATGQGNAGSIKVTGKLIASGKKHHQQGGNVSILGNDITLTDNASIDVSGNTGGGQVLIGGNAHGAGPEQNANYVYVDKSVAINADALVNGNGGKVVVWSNLGTEFDGLITARGGALSGNGGWVETSGGVLNYNGVVDESALNGQYGSLLLDPQFLIVAASGGSSYTAGTNNLYGNNVGMTSIITPASIAAAAANITLQANTDVIFNDALSMTSAGKTLTVSAGRSILVNANIATTNGAISMTANNNAATSSDRLTTSTNNPTGDNETTAGNITMASGTTINSGTAATTLTIGSSNTAPFTPGSININNITSKNLTVNSQNAVTVNGAISSTGLVTINANQSGGSAGFNLASGGSITTTNTTFNAVAINVNTASGGTGGAILGGGNIATGANGTISIATDTGSNTTGGSITQSGTGVITFGSNSGNINLTVPTNGLSSVGTLANPVLIGASPTGATTLTVAAGSGGADVSTSDTGTISLNAPTLGTGAPFTILAPNGSVGLPFSAMTTTGNIDIEGLGGPLTVSNNITTTGNITLKAQGINVNNNVVVNAGTGNITLYSPVATLTIDNNSQLLTGNANGTAGIIDLIADTMILSTGATPAQIGGTATGTGLANAIIIEPITSTTTFGIAGGSGSYLLTQAEANDFQATNVRIGNASQSGNISIGAFTPNANFAKNGVITFETSGTVTQSGAINLATSNSGLLLRNASNVVLTNTSNDIPSIAATNIAGAFSVTNNTADSLSVSRLTDDIGAVNGIDTSAGNGNVTLVSGATSGVGFTQNSSTTINSGSGTISIDSGAGAMNLNLGTLITTNNSASAIQLVDATTAALGNINAQFGTLVLGAGNISGAITQNSTTAINANNITANTTGSINLNNAANTITNLGTVTRGGSFTLANTGTLSINNALTSGALSNAVNISTTGLLTVGANITTTGSNNNITLNGSGITHIANTSVNANGSTITENAGTGTLTLNSGSLLLSTGTINLTADHMSFNTGVTPAGIGGSGAGVGFASNIILQPNSINQTIGIAGGVGNLQLTTAMLNLTRSNNLRIGNSTAGNINLSAWTPNATVADNGVLTLDTAHSITQNGILNLATDNAGLLLRDSTNATLNQNNMFATLAANMPGALSATTTQQLTVGQLTDDIGIVHGINATNGVTLNASSSGIVLNNSVNANTIGNSIVLAGSNFTNNVGSAAINPGSGSFLIWTQNPSGNVLNGLGYNFAEYNATYGSTAVQGSGNGFLYTLAPTITASLVGTVTKEYDGTTTATLSDTNYSVSGAINGDVVTLNNPTLGVFGTPEVGSNENVSVTGIAINNASNHGINIYGYQLASSTANANIGTITAKPLTVNNVTADNKTYDGTTTATLNTNNVILSGVIAGDNVNVTSSHYTANFATPNVGSNVGVNVTTIYLVGSDANNYLLMMPTNLSADILPATSVSSNEKTSILLNAAVKSISTSMSQSGAIATSSTSQNADVTQERQTNSNKVMPSNRTINANCIQIGNSVDYCKN